MNIELNGDMNVMFDYVKDFLAKTGGESPKWEAKIHGGVRSFRVRSEHTKRVFRWAKRLLDDVKNDVAVDTEAVLIAAIFHDVGYGLSETGDDHAKKGAGVFEEYAAVTNMDKDKSDFISYLIRNHSNEATFNDESTPLELVILMEADSLDELGAMSILWDCLAEGSQSEQSYVKAYERIKQFSGSILSDNPMRTAKAREYWAQKQDLVKVFLNQLEIDLGK